MIPSVGSIGIAKPSTRAGAAPNAAWSFCFIASALSMVLLLAGCSGGSNGTTSQTTVAPSALTYPTATISVMAGQAISIDTPTVSGTSPTFSVSPALPAGLSLNASTGTISGTPTTAVPQTTYTVTASNSAGSTTTAVVITVAAAVTAPTNLVYLQGAIAATQNQAITPDTPTVSGTSPTFSVSPALPAGLSINASTGTISGTPTVAAAQATYTVTASNSAGSTTATLSIAVAAVIAPTALVYPVSTISATTGQALTPDTPTVSGTSPTFSVSPALPAGLSLNPATGTISGTPTAVTAQASYTVTASNSSGTTTEALIISVAAGVVAPSNLVYPQTAIAANQNQLITPDTPTFNGTSPTFTISPALPAGLSINATTGSITGVPTATVSQTTYMVTATNTAGSTTASLTISVGNGLTSFSFSYPTTNVTVEVGDLPGSDIPTVVGTISSFSISPALPAGLSLNPSTGAISGTPTAVSPATTYVVEGNGSGGVTYSQIQITVSAAVPALLNLGQSTGGTVQMSTTRVLSKSDEQVNATIGPGSIHSGHWTLNDYITGAFIADGYQGADGTGTVTQWPVAIGGSTLAIGVANGIDIRSAVDGHLVLTLVSPLIDPVNGTGPGSGAWWVLATDGSYVAAGSASGMSIWSTITGAVLFSEAGDYHLAQAFGAPTQLQIAQGAAGQNVIETISTATYTSTTGPTFSGTFSAWFYDGGSFITSLSNTVWIYSAASVQEDLVTVSSVVSVPGTPSLGGDGNYFWTYGSGTGGYVFTLYNVTGTSPVATETGSVSFPVVPSNGAIALLGNESTQITLIDISGSSPVISSPTLPLPAFVSFASLSASKWIVENSGGAIVDTVSSATPRYLTLGSAWSIAGATNSAAVATVSGSIYDFAPPSNTVLTTIPYTSDSLSISSDGTVLAAFAGEPYDLYAPDRSLNFYSLPSGSLTSSLPSTYSNSGSYRYNATMSASGTTIAQEFVTSGSSNSTATVGPLNGTAVWTGSVNYHPVLALSPDGTWLAVGQPLGTIGAATNLYHNGILATAVSGTVVGWLDNTRFVVDVYTSNLGTPVFSTSTIYNTSGTALGPANLNGDVHSFQPVDANDVYVPKFNQILSLTTGQAIWTGTFSQSPGVGAVSGSYIVYMAHDRVFAQTH